MSKAYGDLIDADGRGWGEALREGRLTLPRCTRNGHWFFPPLPHCPRCGSEVELAPIEGVGTVYSWIVTHVAFDPAFADELPYTVVTATMAEGPRLVGRLVGDEAGLAADAPLRAEPYTTEAGTFLGLRLDHRGEGS
ncbi:MAG TPA: OB-fold domain-containing protein [Solirubrobacterales bacterium]|jgi:hypothetical protein|nr:OB-fold domain-containing protein [Solirubrobacterales bacterium]